MNLAIDEAANVLRLQLHCRQDAADVARIGEWLRAARQTHPGAPIVLDLGDDPAADELAVRLLRQLEDLGR